MPTDAAEVEDVEATTEIDTVTATEVVVVVPVVASTLARTYRNLLSMTTNGDKRKMSFNPR